MAGYSGRFYGGVRPRRRRRTVIILTLLVAVVVISRVYNIFGKSPEAASAESSSQNR